MMPLNKVRYVYRLSMKLVDPGKGDARTALARRDRFSVLLVEHLKPHVKHLGLADSMLKFMGDGWSIMTDRAEKVSALCCLATIVANTFQDETARITGIDPTHIHPLAISVLSGRDRLIELPDGRKEWVGDSARRASEVLNDSDGVIIDSHVAALVQNVFATAPAGGMAGSPTDGQDDVPLLVLGEFIVDDIAETGASDSVASYIYTLGILGRAHDAAALAHAATRRASVSDAAGAGGGQSTDVVEQWNALLVGVPDFGCAREVLESMREAGMAPNSHTYKALIAKAPDYEAVVTLVEEMRAGGIEPDEEAYAALIAKAPDFTVARDIFSEMKGKGFSPGAESYGALAAKAPDYETVKSLMEAMQREGGRPGVEVYNALIAKSTDHDMATFWLQAMLINGVQPDIAIYNALIAKAPDFDTARLWLETMKAEGIQPNLTTYNRLMPKAPDYEWAHWLLAAVRDEGVRPNIVAYNTLITKAVDFENARSWLEAMQADGIRPNLDTYNRLFSKNISRVPASELLSWYREQEYHPEEPMQTAMATYRKFGRIDHALYLAVEYPHLPGSRKLIREIMDEVFAYLEAIREDDKIIAGVRGFNTIIAKAPYFDIARSWLDTMRKKGIDPDFSTYNTLIAKAPGFDAALSLVEMMSRDGITPGVDTYHTLFSKDLSGTSARDILTWYHAQQFHPDEPVETAIRSFKKIGRADQALRLALEYPQLCGARELIKEYMSEVLAYLETVKQEGIKPHVVTYSTLIAKAPYFDIAEAWLETMRARGIKPNVVTYNTLIFKAPDFETAEALLADLRHEGIAPNVITYSTLISKAERYADAVSLWETMRGEGVKANVITYNALILKAPDYEAAHGWLATMDDDNVAPDLTTYNTLIFKAPDFETATSLLEEMSAADIQPNIVTYNRLFSKSLAAQPAEELLSWYRSQKYRPDEPVQAAISAYRKAGKMHEALRLAIEYPHLQVARKLMREQTDEALAYFKAFFESDPGHPNRDYALGVCLAEGGCPGEAKPHLIKAFEALASGPRRTAIEGLVDRLVKQ